MRPVVNYCFSFWRQTNYLYCVVLLDLVRVEITHQCEQLLSYGVVWNKDIHYFPINVLCYINVIRYLEGIFFMLLRPSTGYDCPNFSSFANIWPLLGLLLLHRLTSKRLLLQAFCSLFFQILHSRYSALKYSLFHILSFLILHVPRLCS